MFLEAFLYFVLGFLCAGLLALMVLPLIWNRAVELTTQKIESSVPLTLNEIQAEKDQLRAEFAMSTRRLEINIEQLQEKLTAQTIEINQKRDDFNKIGSENIAFSKDVEALKGENVTLTKKISESDIALAKREAQFEELGSSSEAAALQISELKEQLSEKEAYLNSQRIELAAKNTKIDALTDALERSENANSGFLSNEIEKLSSQVSEQQAKNTELEAKLAADAQKFETISQQATDKDVQSAVSSLKENLSHQSEKVAAIKKERDALIAEVKKLSSVAQEEWADERKNSSILRERINDMAAQVAHLTQELEGDTSPIKDLVNEQTTTKVEGPKSSGSLASRIRALQKTATAN